jgi:HD-GYP domain-containing protein (c-di-GMP phosphodiesterase class II)
MTPQIPLPFLKSEQVKTQTSFVFKKLWRWLIEPSSKITRPDHRRQAVLLSGFLLGLILIAVVTEAYTDSVIDWTAYTGYRQTIAFVTILAIVYFLSRTQYLQLAAILAVMITSLGVFMSGWGEPRGVAGGLFDFLIIPLWLGSLFIDVKKLPFLIGGVLAGLLIFPILVPVVTLNVILIGPFTFNLVTSVLLLIVTLHRNDLEQIRRAESSANEQASRREAARADALLRVASRLNAQLDLEAVITAIGEEVSNALNIPVSIVTLYDRKQDNLYVAASIGLSPDLMQSLPIISRSDYDHAIETHGAVFSIRDVQSISILSTIPAFKKAGVRSLALVTMEYEQDLIGSLCAVTLSEPRDFTKDELLLLQGLAAQAALAIVNTRLYKDARLRLERLQALRTIDIAITTNRDLRENLDVLMNKITDQLKVDAVVFLLLDENRQQLEFASSLGFQTPTLRFTRLRLGEGIAGRAAQQKQVIHIQDLRTDPQTLVYAPTLAQEGFASYYATPLIAQGQVKGVMEIFHRTQLNPDDEWLTFLEALAGQAAIAIQSTTLFRDLQLANEELSQAYDSTIEGWSHALDLRDKETEGHTRRVTELTLRLAQAMHLSDDELLHIRRGALLHDIGKMGVPDGILLKAGPLTDEEWILMRQHPQFAFDMLAPIDYLKRALDIPYCHHEKWDGTGYPRGLKDKDIPLAARIFAVVDVYDALTSDRPYRKAWSKQKTLEHIRSLAGTHFDPNAVELFTATMNEELERIE